MTVDTILRGEKKCCPALNEENAGVGSGGEGGREGWWWWLAVVSANNINRRMEVRGWAFQSCNNKVISLPQDFQKYKGIFNNYVYFYYYKLTILKAVCYNV